MLFSPQEKGRQTTETFSDCASTTVPQLAAGMLGAHWTWFSSAVQVYSAKAPVCWSLMSMGKHRGRVICCIKPVTVASAKKKKKKSM